MPPARRCLVCDTVVRGRSPYDDHVACAAVGTRDETPREGALRLAQAQVERWSEGDTPSTRRWLGPVACYSYGDAAHGTALFVLEGSPPRGCVVVFDTGDALALGLRGARRLYRVRVLEQLRAARPGAAR